MDDLTTNLQAMETTNKCLTSRIQYLEKTVNEYTQESSSINMMKRRIKYLEGKLDDYLDAFEDLNQDFEEQRIELQEAKEDRHHFMTLCDNMVGVAKSKLEETLQVVVNRNMDTLRKIMTEERKWINC